MAIVGKRTEVTADGAKNADTEGLGKKRVVERSGCGWDVAGGSEVLEEGFEGLVVLPGLGDDEDALEAVDLGGATRLGPGIGRHLRRYGFG